MPDLARLYLRTSLAYLLVGGVLGGILLWNKGAALWPSVWVLLGAHIAVMMWGWLLHLSLGVAYWALPRRGGQRPRSWLVGAAYGCLNAGIIAAAWGGLIPARSTGGWFLAAGGVLQFLAILAFTLHAWPRVRPAGVA
jgi:hypothetical protein